MGFTEPVEQYSGRINEVTIGRGERAITIGGETTLPFYLFEGEIPNQPLIAMEVYDKEPVGWAEALAEVFGDVWHDPIKWALKCQEEYQAEAICLQLASTDPNNENTSADEAANISKAVIEAVKVPVIIYGCGNAEKDAEVLKRVAEVGQGQIVVLGPAVEDNYKSVGAAALGFNQVVAAQTPIDVNMAKQLNILLTNLGLPANRILIDPSTGALGYGLEYTYSVIERDRLAALQQNDTMMQMPIICNLGKEVWKSKEARASLEDEPGWGDPVKRGILWEAITATSLLIAGADVLIMRHPEAVRLVKETIRELIS
jgi:CO dehydrogenase/acetyl-CoA synthase delta subunit